MSNKDVITVRLPLSFFFFNLVEAEKVMALRRALAWKELVGFFILQQQESVYLLTQKSSSQEFLPWCGGLKDPALLQVWYGSESVPDRGTFVCYECSHGEKTKTNKQKSSHQWRRNGEVWGESEL